MMYTEYLELIIVDIRHCTLKVSYHRRCDYIQASTLRLQSYLPPGR